MRLLPLFLVACATPTTTAPLARTPTGGPRGLHASEHREVAREHDEVAWQQHAYPVITPMTPGDPTTGLQVVPWVRRWDPAVDHERLAKIHRSEAAALEAAYAEACGTRELKSIAESPLARHRLGGWDTKTGVIVYLSPTAGTAWSLLADLKCHRAWMMLTPQDAMDDCPLDLPGLVIDARGDQSAITLVLSVQDPRLVSELQRRIAKQVEQVKP